MTERLSNIIVGVQNFIIVSVLVFFAWDLTTQNYTSFTDAPPNIADKTWYLGEGYIFLAFGVLLVLFNKALKDCCNFAVLYKDVWTAISIFFLIRFLWIITWIRFGLSANMNIAQAILFAVLLASIILITCLPLLKKIFKDTK